MAKDLYGSYRANHLLAALGSEDLERLLPNLSLVEIRQDELIFDAHQPAPQVWFPLEGLISVVAVNIAGSAMEIATIGREGMTGVALALGNETIPNEAIVHIPGFAARMETLAFRRALDESPTFRQLIQNYVLALFSQVSQNAACNQLHDVAARCARWLLTAHDNVDGDHFLMTQEALGLMLGVTRPSISAAASHLRDAAVIDYSRGAVVILDRRRLEEIACDCHRIVEDEFSRLRALNDRA